MSDYRPGQEAFYHDSGEVDKVIVLENNSNSEWERYVLRVEEVVRESGVVKPSQIGETFSCEKRKDVCMGGLWHLLDHA